LNPIDWLNELDETLASGRQVLASPAAVEKEWVIGKPIEQLRTIAQRVADSKKAPVSIVKLIPNSEAMPGDLFLVPTKLIEPPDHRALPQIKWSLIDTKEAAEMMRDVKYGPSPFFGIQTFEEIEPSEAAKAQLID